MELTLTPELEALLARKLAADPQMSVEQIVTKALKNALLVDEQRSAALSALRHMIDDNSDESASARDFLRRSGEQLRDQV